MKELKKIGSRRVPLYLGLLLLAAVAMWMLKTCSVAVPSVISDDKASGGDTIDVAIDYGPMSLFTYDDTLGGFNYDLMREIAAKEGLHVKFHPVTTPSQAIEGLNANIYDVIVSDLPVTLEDSGIVAFTEPVYLDKQVLVQRREPDGKVRVKNQLELAGREVWVVANSPSVGRLQNLSGEIGDTIIVHEEPSYGAEQLVLMVAVGDIPMAVVNEKTARRLAADYSQLDVSTAISFTQFQSWAVRKNDELLADSINAMIRRFKATPAYDCLVNRYNR